MDTDKVAVVSLAVAVGTWVLQWAFQRFVRKADAREEHATEETRATLGRIETKTNMLHTDLMLLGGRTGAIEKTVEHLQERVNGGLLDHRIKIENLTERVVRVETKIEDGAE